MHRPWVAVAFATNVDLWRKLFAEQLEDFRGTCLLGRGTAYPLPHHSLKIIQKIFILIGQNLKKYNLTGIVPLLKMACKSLVNHIHVLKGSGKQGTFTPVSLATF